jgi:N-acetylglutamate synthase/N-acetylornithine aminotransferase
MKTTLLLAVLLVLTACEPNPQRARDAGQSVENALENVGQSLQNAAEGAGQAVEDAVEGAENAARGAAQAVEDTTRPPDDPEPREDQTGN